jgi:hypothetical protein
MGRKSHTWAPLSYEYYQKMQRSTTRKNQEEHGPEVKQVWRNHQKTIAVEKMSQTKPHASVPLPPPAKSNGEYFPRVFHVVIPDPPNSPAILTRHSGWQLLGEWVG